MNESHPSNGSATPPAPPAEPAQGLPRTRSCFVCGVENPHGLRARPRREADGRVALDYAPRVCDCGYRGVVHGGIVMTLLDEVMTWAALLESGRLCVAAELTTRLLKPVAPGVPLRVEARVVRAGRLLKVEGAALDAAGEPAARAEGKYLPMPDAMLGECEKDFLPGPELDAWRARSAGA